MMKMNDRNSKMVRKPAVRYLTVKKKLPRSGSAVSSYHPPSISKRVFNKKDIEKLENQGKRVLQDLRYIEDVVKKKILQLLPGSTTVVLETFMEFFQTINSYISQSDSTVVESQCNHVCVSLADLVRWSDNILLHGPEALNEEEANEVIKNFKDSLQELIKVVIERISKKATLRNCQSFPSKPPSVTARLSIADEGTRDLDVPVPPPLPEKRRMTTSQDSSSSLFSDRSTPTVQSPLVPAEITSPQSSTAARWSRTTSQSTDSYLDRSDVSPHATPLNQSPTSSVSSVFSGSSEDLLADRTNRNYIATLSPTGILNKTSSHMESQSTSQSVSQSSCSCSQSVNSSISQSAGTSIASSSIASSSIASSSIAAQSVEVTGKMQNLAVNINNQDRHSTGSSSGSDCGPPPLPDKPPKPPRRVPSLYDNMPEEEGQGPQETKVEEKKVEEQQSSEKVVLRRLRNRLSDENEKKRSGILLDNLLSDADPNADPQGPPPLPPKMKMVHTYMHMFGQYQSPEEELFRHSVHSLNFYQSQWNQFQEMVCPTRSNTVSFISSASSGRSSDVYSVASGSSGEDGQGMLPFDNFEIHQLPPSLPPKDGGKKRVENGKQSLPEVTPVIPQHDVEVSFLSSVDTVKNCVLHEEYEEENEEEEESGVQDITGESYSSDPQSNRTSTGSSFRPSSPPDCPKDGDSDFSETCLLDEVDVLDHLTRKNPEEDGPEIRGGSVDALVVLATTVNKQDFMFQEAFLTIYRTFISPKDLIDKLLYRYTRFSKIDDAKKKKCSRNAFSFLVRVVGELCMEVDDDVLKNLMDLVYSLLCEAQLMLARILRKKTLEKAEQRRQVQLASQQTTLLSAYQLTAKQCRLTDFKSEHIAEQMTLLDAELFLKIEIPEVLLWAKEQNEEQSPNLAKFTEHFNKVSYWCRTRILEQDDPREREHFLNKFIRIMRHLRKLNNFNSYLAILSAVDSAPIRRLEWQKQNSDALMEFCQLIDSSSSHRAYRQALAETEPPCIPYLGLILQDLTFVHIGNQDFLPNGEVNFAKRWQQFNILDNMKRFKKCDYEIKKNQKILTYFDNFSNYLCEESLWQISETIKPRGTRR